MAGHDRTREFVALFAAHDRGIYKHILTLLVDPGATQEVFQDTSVVLWQKFDEFLPGSSFLAWACRVAYFEVLKFRQNCRRDRLRFDDGLLRTLTEERSAGEGVLQARRAVLPGCMEKLPPSDRELIEQRYAGEETILEIARRTSRPANTLYKALERIRRTLMKCIEKTLAERQDSDSPDGERNLA
jgi:RNA polymerase sigma-70 factor, ECF subfamily